VRIRSPVPLLRGDFTVASGGTYAAEPRPRSGPGPAASGGGGGGEASGFAAGASVRLASSPEMRNRRWARVAARTSRRFACERNLPVGAAPHFSPGSSGLAPLNPHGLHSRAAPSRVGRTGPNWTERASDAHSVGVLRAPLPVLQFRTDKKNQDAAKNTKKTAPAIDQTLTRRLIRTRRARVLNRAFLSLPGR